MRNIYLDYAATTPVDKRVLDAMYPYYSENFGNASSLHSYGTAAKDILESSRNRIASMIGASAGEIVFTSGGTESNNLAVKGAAFANKNKGDHIIVSSIEHDCILNTCKWLGDNGFKITYLHVGSDGIVDPACLKDAITNKTILVSIMHANNEIGTVQPIEMLAVICKERGVLFHSDACQGFGKIPFNINIENADLVSLNSHKICGPKGVGALFVRKGTNIAPLFHGGGQERGLRSSTENIPGIAGFIKAAELMFEEMDNENPRLIRLREQLISCISADFDNFYINGHSKDRLPGILNFSFHGMEGETIRLLLMLDEMGIAVSAGSACSSNHQGSGASHVLKAIGLNPFEARGGIRVSLGRFTGENDINAFREALKTCVLKLNPIYS